MKKLSVLAAILAFAALLSGCATSYPIGSIYTEVKLPVTVGDPKVNTLKKGVAECKSILALVATGDASIEAACRNGNIKVIHHVDWDVENILGIIGKYRCVVYGE